MAAREVGEGAWGLRPTPPAPPELLPRYRWWGWEEEAEEGLFWERELLLWGSSGWGMGPEEGVMAEEDRPPQTKGGPPR